MKNLVLLSCLFIATRVLLTNGQQFFQGLGRQRFLRGRQNGINRFQQRTLNGNRFGLGAGNNRQLRRRSRNNNTFGNLLAGTVDSNDFRGTAQNTNNNRARGAPGRNSQNSEVQEHHFTSFLERFRAATGDQLLHQLSRPAESDGDSGSNFSGSSTGNRQNRGSEGDAFQNFDTFGSPSFPGQFGGLNTPTNLGRRGPGRRRNRPMMSGFGGFF